MAMILMQGLDSKTRSLQESYLASKILMELDLAIQAYVQQPTLMTLDVLHSYHQCLKSFLKRYNSTLETKEESLVVLIPEFQQSVHLFSKLFHIFEQDEVEISLLCDTALEFCSSNQSKDQDRLGLQKSSLEIFDTRGYVCCFTFYGSCCFLITDPILQKQQVHLWMHHSRSRLHSLEQMIENPEIVSSFWKWIEKAMNLPLFLECEQPLLVWIFQDLLLKSLDMQDRSCLQSALDFIFGLFRFDPLTPIGEFTTRLFHYFGQDILKSLFNVSTKYGVNLILIYDVGNRRKYGI